MGTQYTVKGLKTELTRELCCFNWSPKMFLQSFSAWKAFPVTQRRWGSRFQVWTSVCKKVYASGPVSARGIGAICSWRTVWLSITQRPTECLKVQKHQTAVTFSKSFGIIPKFENAKHFGRKLKASCWLRHIAFIDELSIQVVVDVASVLAAQSRKSRNSSGWHLDIFHKLFPPWRAKMNVPNFPGYPSIMEPNI